MSELYPLGKILFCIFSFLVFFKQMFKILVIVRKKVIDNKQGALAYIPSLS